MKKLVIKILAFILLFASLLLSFITVTSLIVKNRDFTINNSDSNTLVMGKNEHFDLMFTGSSHARNFSRHYNNSRVEKILDKSITNIAQGTASCGIEEQFFYLKYFYDEGNTVDELVYVLSPPLLFSEMLPLASNTFNDELLSFRFFNRYLNHSAENKDQRLFEYFRSKLTRKWVCLTPFETVNMTKVLEKVDSLAVEKAVAAMYNPDTSLRRFKNSCNIIDEEITYAKEHNTKVVVIVSPAVFGKWPGHERLINFLNKMEEKHKIHYYDFSESVMDPKYYYDHHHLNTAGVVYFTEKFLKPVL